MELVVFVKLGLELLEHCEGQEADSRVLSHQAVQDCVRAATLESLHSLIDAGLERFQVQRERRPLLQML